MRYIVCVCVLVVHPAFGADANGYVARYESVVGSPPACDTIISSVNDPDWAKLNDSSYRVMCLEPGDYTSLGKITLTASGSPGQERWLRYYSANDTGIHPVRQLPANHARLQSLEFTNASSWIIHRLTFDGERTGPIINFLNRAERNIVDSVLVENAGQSSVKVNSGADGNALQNSVVRDNKPIVGRDVNCVELAGGPKNTRIVNNELYNCTKAVYINETNTADGTVVENNDMYITPSTYTDCNGNYDVSGVCSVSKAMLSMKSGGTATNIVRVIQNRIWGVRLNDRNICCTALAAGHSVTFSNSGDGRGDANYVLFKNNIVMDGHSGLGWTREGPRNSSIVGNIIYGIHRFNTDPVRNRPSYAISNRVGDQIEIYFNTIIEADSWLHLQSGAQNNDIRCNVIINSGAREGSSIGAGTSVDYNAFYNTPVFSTKAQGNDIIHTDVSVANMQPYCFFRKLLTAREQVCIAHARPTNASPHRNACQTNIVSTDNIGVTYVEP